MSDRTSDQRRLEVRLRRRELSGDVSVIGVVEDTETFSAKVIAALPGREYMGLFDLVHAAVLGWSPNLRASLPWLSSVAGSEPERHVEDLIDALTYGLATAIDDFRIADLIDPEFVESVTRAARTAPQAPEGRTDWERCLGTCLAVFRRALRGAERFVFDLETGEVWITDDSSTASDTRV